MMPIPQAQFETWSHQGSVTQSSGTYNTIKNALEADGTPYGSHNYVVFLQGSYGNATNVYRESDVDIIIQLNDCFSYDISTLPQGQQNAFYQAFPGNASYGYPNFKADVHSVLLEKYGGDVFSGDKAIAIAANGSRRKADVISAVMHRKFWKFVSPADYSCVEGICFYTSTGKQIANYPKLHSRNLTIKHQSSSSRFKPMVRVMKNLRNRLISEHLLDSSDAPSYYLEGLLYNVPTGTFTSDLRQTFVDCYNWISKADRATFGCANEQYPLLDANSPVSWHADKCDKFLNAVSDLWNQW